VIACAHFFGGLYLAFGQFTFCRYRSRNGGLCCFLRHARGDCVWLLLVNAARRREESGARRVPTAAQNRGHQCALGSSTSFDGAGGHLCGKPGRCRACAHHSCAPAEERGCNRASACHYAPASTRARIHSAAGMGLRRAPPVRFPPLVLTKASCPGCGARVTQLKRVSPELTQGSRHCEEQSDEAIQVLFLDCFALRFALGSQ
jgi:hypothetical protein